MQSRRWFLEKSVFTGVGLLVGCVQTETIHVSGNTASGSGGALSGTGVGGGGGVGGSGGAMSSECADLVSGGQSLGMAAFNEDGVPFETPLGVGWDGRLYTDLSKIDQNNLLTPTDAFYIRTRYPDQIDPNAPWSIDVGGLVDNPGSLSMSDLTPLVKPMGPHVLECSGNSDGGSFGLLSAAEWSGVPIQDVLDMFQVQSGATRVLIKGFDGHSVPSAGGHSSPGAAWVFTFEQLQQAGAFFATEMNGETLPNDHGFPVRLFVPGWYGCANIKWVDEIRFVDDAEPATSQMREFAWRTHQTDAHALAKDYIPATMDQAAMPIRVEKWRLDGAIVYKLVGIMWGGYELTDKLMISLGNGLFVPVDVCPNQETNATWTVWEHLWKPNATGTFEISMSIFDSDIPTRRLDAGWYVREVIIDEV